MTRRTPRRGGFTLVELLVGIAIVIVLAALAAAVLPGALEQDRTTDGASLTRQWLMIAKARAARDQAPRGVRLIVDTTRPANLIPLVTELQYVEMPPLAVPNPLVGVNPANDPHVFINYTLTASPPTPQGGIVTGRQIVIRNLTLAQAIEYQSMSYLYLPTLNGLHLQVMSVTGPSAQVAPFDTTRFTLTMAPARTIELDDEIGAANQYATFHFGVLGAVRPLVGEQTQQLPKGICIDVNSSSPAWNGAGDYDIVFAPNGQVLSLSSVGSSAQIHLWVRDMGKPGGLAALGGNFNEGGEQQVVSLKAKSGALGVFPVAFPPASPYAFALQGASAPSQ
ncbi:MAG: prepilin-type N-terminal cleavage/methylation domain-containing protein [Gemmataceae bacterium]|nr:prepilin-type N-terminal cleavage/methylation domain-containing protein [Gemmataceae bacterium]